MDDETRDALDAVSRKVDALAIALHKTRLELHDAKRSLLDLCIADYDAIVIAIANATQDRELAKETMEQLRSRHALVKARAGVDAVKEAGEADGE